MRKPPKYNRVQKLNTGGTAGRGDKVLTEEERRKLLEEEAAQKGSNIEKQGNDVVDGVTKAAGAGDAGGSVLTKIPFAELGELGAGITTMADQKDQNTSILGAAGADGLRYAGKGAAIGTMIAPGVGTAVGAGLGAALGLGLGAYKGKKANDAEIAATDEDLRTQALANRNQLNYVAKSETYNKKDQKRTLGIRGMFAQGGEIKGPGGPKEDKISADVKKGSFIVPAENAEVAEEIREKVLRKPPSKASLKQKNGTPVKLSNGEHMFTPEERTELESKGVNVAALAPNAKEGNEFPDGGKVGEKKKPTPPPGFIGDRMVHYIGPTDSLLTPEQIASYGYEQLGEDWKVNDGTPEGGRKTYKPVYFGTPAWNSPDNPYKDYIPAKVAPSRAGVPTTNTWSQKSADGSVKNYFIPTPAPRVNPDEEDGFFANGGGVGDRNKKIKEGSETTTKKPAATTTTKRTPPKKAVKSTGGKFVVPPVVENEEEIAAQEADLAKLEEAKKQSNDKKTADDFLRRTTSTLNKQWEEDMAKQAEDESSAAAKQQAEQKVSEQDAADKRMKMIGLGLSTFQAGLGIQQLTKDGKRPVDKIDPTFDRAVDQAVEDAKTGLTAEQRASLDSENIKLKNQVVENINNAAGGNGAVALSNTRAALNDTYRRAMKVTEMDQQMRQQKQQYANGLLGQRAEMKRRLFADKMSAFEQNQEAGANLLGAGIRNYLGSLRYEKELKNQQAVNQQANSYLGTY